MRRILFIAAALLLSISVTSQAQANIFDTPGHYRIKYSGFEYAYDGAYSDFLAGNVGMRSTQSQLVDAGALQTGFSMTALLYATTIGVVDGDGEADFANPLYSNGPGLYFVVLHDLTVAASTGNLLTDDAKIYFTGGTVDWYFADAAVVGDVSTLKYTAGVGLSKDGVTAIDLTAFGDPFATFALDGSNGYSGSAAVKMQEGYLFGEATFTGNAEQGSIFDSNAFHGFDITIRATLNWSPTNGRFNVNDPADVVVTPEPSSLVLMALGLMLSGFFIRRHRRNNSI